MTNKTNKPSSSNQKPTNTKTNIEVNKGFKPISVAQNTSKDKPTPKKD